MINFVPKLNWVKKPLFIIYFFLIGSIFAQELRFSANFILSQKPLNKVQIKVLDIAQNKIIDNFNSENSDKVKIDMETGNNYRIYFSHPKIHPIFFEIIANNMSENDLYNKFDYQMDIDFIPNTESNVDTAFLSRHPIHRVIFNNKKFEDDIKYNTWAESKIFKEESLSNDFSEQKFKIPYNIAGTLFIKSGNNLSPLLKRDIILYKTTNKPYYTKQCFRAVSFQ